MAAELPDRFTRVLSPSLLTATRSVLLEAVQVYSKLLKVMLPALVIVKILQELGAIDFLGNLLGPVMSLIGLPAVMGVVWATTLMTNMFTGLVVFFQITGDLSLTVEQVTVFGTLMLMGHSLAVEGAIAKRAGVPYWVTTLLRAGGAFVLGGILHVIYSRLDLLQEPVAVVWRLEAGEDTLLAWLISQLQALVMIFFIILALILLMKLLRRIGIEKLIHLGLAPLLRFMGIGQQAANVTVIGVALGLTYGAGLLFRDLDNGVMSRRDGFLALCFLGLVHSLIEDTLLIMALGADLSGILWARLFFSIAVIAVLARVMAYVDNRSVVAR